MDKYTVIINNSLSEFGVGNMYVVESVNKSDINYHPNDERGTWSVTTYDFKREEHCTYFGYDLLLAHNIHADPIFELGIQEEL